MFVLCREDMLLSELVIIGMVVEKSGGPTTSEVADDIIVGEDGDVGPIGREEEEG